MRSIAHVVMAPLALLACGPTTPSRDACVTDAPRRVPSPACMPAPPAPQNPNAPPGRVFVTTSDYVSGALRWVRGASGERSPEPGAVISADGLLAAHGRDLVVLNFGAIGNDNVAYYDIAAAAPGLRYQVAMRRGCERSGANPRAYLPLCENRALVARFNQNDLAVVDLVDGALIEGENIPLGEFALDGSQPYPNGLAWSGTRVLVMLARLPPGLTNPSVRGAVALLDPVTRTLIDADPSSPARDAIELHHPNPVGSLRPYTAGTFLVACAGSYLRVGDGAVEQIDPTVTPPAVRDVVTEADVMGNIDSVLPLDGDRLLLRVSSEAVGMALDVATIRLIEWSVSTRSVLRTWLTLDRYTLTEPLLGRDGNVYVGDRGDEPTRRPSGVRVFDPRTPGMPHELTTEGAPIAVGLPPYFLLEEPSP